MSNTPVELSAYTAEMLSKHFDTISFELAYPPMFTKYEKVPWHLLPQPDEQTAYIITPTMVAEAEAVLNAFAVRWRRDFSESSSFDFLNLVMSPRIVMVLKGLVAPWMIGKFFEYVGRHRLRLGELSDRYLPLDKEDLMWCFGEPLASKFFRNQHSALARDLPKGGHLDLKPFEYPPFRHRKNLGSGAFGSVDLVENVFTHELFARKTLYSHQHKARAHSEFTKEIANLRKLGNHHHIAELAGSYVKGKDLCLLILPVADYSLLDLFSDPEALDQVEDLVNALYRSFGCLTMGLDYMHRNQIRHKDIKPGNILMQGDRFIFTDFGLAFDFSELERSTTSGRPNAMTKKYCPIEVIEWGHRGRSADVFSLGCVFVQVLTILAGKSLDGLDDHLSGNEDASLDGVFCFNLDKVNAWLSATIDLSGDQRIKMGTLWCELMLCYESTHRVKTHDLLERMFNDINRTQLFPIDFFCENCESIVGSKNENLASVGETASRARNENFSPVRLAIYLGVSVWEMEVNGVTVMRRRADSWLNVTQILEVSGVEEGKQTKVLEEELLFGEYETIQRSYGKYYGIWSMYYKGVELCHRYGVEDLLKPLLVLHLGLDSSVADQGSTRTRTDNRMINALTRRLM
ncbi:MAG: hypothetical protein M1836_000827 [Candelina mexicana]|nr:MAG: hypothetical protein M1836_000827 [Candelina mexicana]